MGWNYEIFIQAGLLILGCWWCKEILGRLRDDVAELKQPDATRKGVIIGLWLVTAVIIAVMANFAWSVIAGAVHAFH